MHEKRICNRPYDLIIGILKTEEELQMKERKVDLCIVGGSAAGMSAAIIAKRKGAKNILILMHADHLIISCQSSLPLSFAPTGRHAFNR